ncbi:MAG: orotidine-5'-phosphate decarboxylase, partial [bacterium]|nr:orotidine-5'-phosphate decarboxylase [bacterium]
EADAVTVNPYMGMDAIKPFLDHADKGVVVLCRTSNPGAKEIQEIKTAEGIELYKHVAKLIAGPWNYNGNTLLVAGATFPEELGEIRRIVGDVPLLVPGIGAQGGDVEKVMKNGVDSRGNGLIINSSRGIIYASDGDDFAEAARKAAATLRDTINRYR